MPNESLQRCSDVSVTGWDAIRGWQHQQIDLHQVISHESNSCNRLISAESRLCFIRASANTIRECELCRQYFINTFHMPRTWWSDYSRKSNGYFGCQASITNADSALSTWAYFEIKHLDKMKNYHWLKLNVFIQWLPSPSQTIVLVFDTPLFIIQRIQTSMVSPTLTCLDDPFWFYTYLMDEVARLQELAVWGIRNQVRDVEKERKPSGRPQPNYRGLHDIARHAIHVSETLDVAIQTMKRMLARHEHLMDSTIRNDVSQEIHSQLQFFESFISSLRCRSASNEKRMLNEIQLAFNTVAQHDANTSVKIGLATQEDSDTMKSIAFVTLTFLPPTFVCAIFSMSFFDYSPESGWTVSNQFWLYWAFAMPTTLLTALVWYWLRRTNTSALAGDNEQRPTIDFRTELVKSALDIERN
ncbi:hypothetical protein F5Y19DRAFT_486500 [Xylariaceae sp. FL1651]|nr:hypothetical protein F5Y19DRAFT_486500 [Xylariaceae sp. FL1651]